MVDGERNAELSAVDDEMGASDDTDQRSSDGDVDDVDDASSSSNGPAYDRVAPRDETVTRRSGDDIFTDVAAGTDDNGDDFSFDTDVAPDDADDSATDSDADSDDEPRLLMDDEHTSHVPEGIYDDPSNESADDIDPDAAADGANPAPAGEDEMGGVTPSPVSAEGADFDNEDVGSLAGEVPESDREMPLTARIEEMIRRLAVVLGVAGAITLVLLPDADVLSALMDMQTAFGAHIPNTTDVIDLLQSSHISGAKIIVDRRPRLYGPPELILTEPKVAGLAGTVIGLPVLIYEMYLFMCPGLYPKEREYYLMVAPTSLALALVGALFAHFVVLLAISAYFTPYTEGAVVVAPGLRETFNFILILMDRMTVVFQIPLFVKLAITMNLVTRRWLEDHHPLFWDTFLSLAFLVSPGPTEVASIITSATMITLFERTLAALYWTGN